jgi:hypothetical protein
MYTRKSYFNFEKLEYEMKTIREMYPNAKVMWYTMRTDCGRNYVIEAKEDGKIVYSTLTKNK